MHELVLNGEFKECTDIEKLKEIKLLIENISGCNGYIASDHIINLLDRVNGHLDKDIPKILNYINEFLSLPRYNQRQYQMARRMGFNGDFKELSKLDLESMNTVNMYCKTLSEEKFEELLIKYLNLYI